jgi:hypothetical protein
MDQETSIRVADAASPFSSNLGNLELSKSMGNRKRTREKRRANKKRDDTSSSDGRTFCRTLMTASKLPWIVRILVDVFQKVERGRRVVG